MPLQLTALTEVKFVRQETQWVEGLTVNSALEWMPFEPKPTHHSAVGRLPLLGSSWAPMEPWRPPDITSGRTSF